MNNIVRDFQVSLQDTYRNNSISTDETFQRSALLRVMETYAPKMTQTQMYEIMYDMYIEEQTALLNECLELISGFNQTDQFEFREE